MYMRFALIELFKEYLFEDNLFTDSNYEIQKLIYSLGLHPEKIDVCIDNCMIYWKTHKEVCRIRYHTKRCDTYQLHKC